MTISESSFFEGYRRPHSVTSEALKRASALLTDAFNAKPYADRKVREAFSTSDFQYASTVALQQQVLADYQAAPPAWRQWCSTVDLPDFRDVELIDYGRDAQQLLPVPELTEYPSVNVAGRSIQHIRIGKYGRRFPISFEAWRNNTAIGEIKNMPGRLLDMAVRTESSVAVSSLVNAAGINPVTFSAANGNAPTNLPLTLDNLDLALQAASARKTADGQFVDTTSWVLVIPPSLKIAADRILATTEIRKTDTTGNLLISSNYLAGTVTAVVEKELLSVNKGAKAAGTWFLLPSPSEARKAFYLGFLMGEQTPELRVKADVGQYVSGGTPNPEEGSFMIDDIQWRVRHFLGAGTGDLLGSYASTGS